MPAWSGIAQEINQEVARGNPQAFDTVRRKYLVKAHQKTGRAVILYATKWTVPDPDVPAALLTINEGDIQGLMEVFHEVHLDQLDLVLHSPGGSIDAADALVSYLRTRFRHIRAVIPHAAMSAAGMIACACDRLIMGKHSFIGPADPQFTLPTPLGGMRQVAVQSILEQFKRAQRECLADQRNLAVWAPIIGQYGPDLIVQAERASTLSRSLVQKWLTQYMFRGQEGGAAKAAEIAQWLSTHENFNSHGRHIDREELRSKQLKVDDLEGDQELQDIYLSLYHATTLTMMSTGSAKIIENHLGKAFINQVQRFVMNPGGTPAGVAPPNIHDIFPIPHQRVAPAAPQPGHPRKKKGRR